MTGKYVQFTNWSKNMQLYLSPIVLKTSHCIKLIYNGWSQVFQTRFNLIFTCRRAEFTTRLYISFTSLTFFFFLFELNEFWLLRPYWYIYVPIHAPYICVKQSQKKKNHTIAVKYLPYVTRPKHILYFTQFNNYGQVSAVARH